MKKVYMIGRGAVGNAFAPYFLEAIPQGFAFICSRERRQKYLQAPLLINGQPVSYPYITPEDDCGPADLILITTKRSGLEQAMELAAPFCDEHTIFMSGINGIESEHVLRARFPRNIVLRSIAQKMDSCYQGSEVTYTSTGELVFGPENQAEEEAAARVRDFFHEIGFPFVYSRDILHDAWKKLMFNCGINQICGAYHKTYGQVAEDPRLMALLIQAMEEVQAVAAAQSIYLSDQEIQEWVAATRALAPDAMPSMAQDILAGRPTEKQLFSGTIVPLARQAGIPVPLLEDLLERIEAIEAARIC